MEVHPSVAVWVVAVDLCSLHHAITACRHLFQTAILQFHNLAADATASQ